MTQTDRIRRELEKVRRQNAEVQNLLEELSREFAKARELQAQFETMVAPKGLPPQNAHGRRLLEAMAMTTMLGAHGLDSIDYAGLMQPGRMTHKNTLPDDIEAKHRREEPFNG